MWRIIIIILLLTSCGTIKPTLNTDREEMILNEIISIQKDAQLLYEENQSLKEELRNVSQYYNNEVNMVGSTDYLIMEESHMSDVYIIKKDTLIFNNSTPKYKKYQIGNVVVNVPDEEMVMGSNYTIKLRISKEDLPKEDLIGKNDNYINNNDIQYTIILDKINISTIMSAYLIDINGAFIIKKGFISEMRNIEDEGFVEWEWNVKPIKSGDNRLKVIANVINEDSNTPTELSVYDNDINIKSNWKYMISSFLSIHWEWAFGVLLIPLITWLWGLFKKMKSKN